MDTTDTGPAPFSVFGSCSRRCREEPAQGRHRLSTVCRRVGWQKPAQGTSACPVLRAPGALEGGFQIGGERRLGVDRFAGDRMREREPCGMQELALQFEVRHAVDPVARDGQVDRREVDADLVRPPRLEPHPQQRVPGQQLDHLEVCDRLARRVRVERLARRLGPVAPDRRLDPPAARARPTADERQVFALEPVAADERLQAAVCPFRPRHDHEPGRVPVEPVDDPGPIGLVASGRPPEQPVDERAGRVSGPRVDGDAGRLVDDEQLLVLVGDAKIERGRDELGRRGRLEFDLLPRLQSVRLRPRRTVDAYVARVQQPLGGRARADLDEPGEETVEPQPGGVRGDGDVDQGRAVEVSARRRGDRSASSSDPTSRQTPTTMQVSARLNAGHQRRSRKSVT